LIEIFYIVVVVAITLWRFRTSFSSGLAATVFFLVLLPIEIRISTGGSLPAITVHRILLMVCLWQVWRRSSYEPNPVILPGVALLVLIAVGRSVSMTMAVDFVLSAKDLLSFLLEFLLFFVLIGKGLRDKETALRLLRAALCAAVIAACLGTFEKYRGINLAARLVPGMDDDWRAVTGTYRHRIMFGYVMAMAFPLAFAVRAWTDSRRQKLLTVAGLILLPAACYFSNSRGPWVGMALGGFVLALTGSRSTRKQLCVLGVIAAIVLLLMPGVQKSLLNRWEQSFSNDTHKGRSASYRLALWGVAWDQVKKSPGRFLFGYGGGSTETMQLGEHFEFGGGSSQLGHTSWDSEYAADFMKYGTFGLTIEAILFLGFLVWCYKAWRSAGPEARNLLGGCLAIVAVFLWAMSNVAIFNPQLHFLFLTVVAVSLRYARLSGEITADSTLEEEPIREMAQQSGV